MSAESLIAAFAAVVVSVLVSMLLWEQRLDDQRRTYDDRLRLLDERISRLRGELDELKKRKGVKSTE